MEFLQKLSLGAKIAIGGFGLAFLSCFLPWYSTTEFAISRTFLGLNAPGGILVFMLSVIGAAAAVIPAFLDSEQLAKPLGFGLLALPAMCLLVLVVSFLLMSAISLGWYLALFAVLVAGGGGLLRAKELQLLGGPPSSSPPPPPPEPPSEPMA